MATIIQAQAKSVTTKTASGGPTTDNMIYPTGLGSNGQDFIKFTAYEYTPAGFVTVASSSGTTSATNPGSVSTVGTASAGRQIQNGSVILPIQSGISDSNMVSWGQDEMNAIDAAKAATALRNISVGGNEDSFGAAITSAISGVAEDALTASRIAGNYRKEIAVYFAGKAANVNNLLARAEGKVVNPNMELLFQGPSLRPFTFQFKLSPRDSREAMTVKNIIRFFKKNMAAKRGGIADKLFLEAPNIFRIEYVNGSTLKEHVSLPIIKVCALQTCNVDYTPDGQYMTFNDEAASMTSYGLSLQFTELEPVYQDEYTNYDVDGVIGF
jgi:hypothetical protein